MVARVPFDVAATWPRMVRRRVVVEVAGQSFRTSVFPDSAHGGHFLLVNKAMQRAGKAGPGETLRLVVAPDLAPREAAPPPELARILKREKALARWYVTLSDSMRREIAAWVHGVESAEARERRATQMAERLLLTLEGEQELPPVLEVAFRGNPAARPGWEAMTVAQRRMCLLAIFYYRTPEARQKRVDKVIADCLVKAGRRRSREEHEAD